MKFYKLGLLTLLISLFILDSCKTQDGIGLDVDPANQINGTLLTNNGVVATTAYEDSIITNNLSIRSPLAYFEDPEFGLTEAGAAAVLSLPGSVAYTVPTGVITVDSAVLVLPYAAKGFYGDSTASTFKVDVRQLDERIFPTKSYYNTKHFLSKSTILGSKEFKPRYNDSIFITSMAVGRADTPMKVRPQVRVKLDPRAMYLSFFGAPASSLANNTVFQNTFNGLSLTLSKSAGAGGNVFFRLDSARVQYYYRRNNAGVIDTSNISLPFATAVTEIKHTFSANVKAAIAGTSTDNLVYLQGLAGLRAKISFPDVKNIFAAQNNKVVINRAELVVTLKPTSGIPYVPAKRLTLYKYDIAHQRVTLQDASTTDPRASVFGGNYNATKGEYHFIVTAFLQDLIAGKTIDYGTYLAPVDPTVTTGISISPAATFAERSIVGGKDAASYNIKLNIIYTKLNQ
ncbi:MULTISPECIES: DUF4270 family protein [unclassified Mucilaginibacter]|uniref:DUF4270 family protein n=3 Tax=Mucilaginibacter TaxID=423349 RepID=UPI002AC941A1|nr:MULTISPECIES: DUF4270 family protein [unclassified Mucilaginibacter]MEB0262031.1 DUF4270 family protein [Mucilaginibacter sp. 10I4]MEB0279705.1 DUF4270 family protein [Mucilaginibacter sp. 10B2]WPX23736.1 DUF4270 family protein [Mucilaginibacter sp. 5C4]